MDLPDPVVVMAAVQPVHTQTFDFTTVSPILEFSMAHGAFTQETIRFGPIPESMIRTGLRIVGKPEL